MDRESRPHCALRCHKKSSNITRASSESSSPTLQSQTELTQLANTCAVGTYYCSCRIQGFGSRSLCFSSLRAINRTGLICHQHQQPLPKSCLPKPLALASCLPRPPSHVLRCNQANYDVSTWMKYMKKSRFPTKTPSMK